MTSTAPAPRTLHHSLVFLNLILTLQTVPFWAGFIGLWLVQSWGLCLELHTWYNTFKIPDTLTRTPHVHFALGPLNYVASLGFYKTLFKYAIHILPGTWPTYHPMQRRGQSSKTDFLRRSQVFSLKGQRPQEKDTGVPIRSICSWDRKWNQDPAR